MQPLDKPHNRQLLGCGLYWGWEQIWAFFPPARCGPEGTPVRNIFGKCRKWSDMVRWQNFWDRWIIIGYSIYPHFEWSRVALFYLLNRVLNIFTFWPLTYFLWICFPTKPPSMKPGARARSSWTEQTRLLRERTPERVPTQAPPGKDHDQTNFNWK